jgi:hypothetical protein
LGGFTADRGHELKGSFYFKNNSYLISSAFLSSYEPPEVYTRTSLSRREYYTSKEYTEYSLMNKEAIVSTVLVFRHPS